MGYTLWGEFCARWQALVMREGGVQNVTKL
jgi:hypothetical protein